MIIFIDTGVFVAVHNAADDNFKSARLGFEKIKARGEKMVTTDYVLHEVYTRLITKMSYKTAMAFDAFVRPGGDAS